MIPESRLESALRSSQPAQALRALALDLFREGRSKEEIYEYLETFVVRQRTRADYRESDEEMILDVMDALTGWCHPEARLSVED